MAVMSGRSPTLAPNMLQGSLLIVLVLGIPAALIVRRRRRRPVALRATSNAALLKELLSQPPDGARKWKH